MLNSFRQELQAKLQKALEEAYPNQDLPQLDLDVPTDKNHGDLSTNIALRAAKILRKKPIDIANEFLNIFTEAAVDLNIEGIEAVPPGFINFTLAPAAFQEVLVQIFKENDRFGQSNLGKKRKVQIEFVSANPTGPLSVAHARQAAVGDALGNILKAVGFDVSKEYYINDEGNQINILGRSIKQRAQQILGENVAWAEDNYQGDYIKDMAQLFMDQLKIKTADGLNKLNDGEYLRFGVDHLMAIIRQELDDFGVHFDVWSSQAKIATKENIEAMLDYLGEKGFLYEKEGALWFKSTDFGDDKDRVVEKSDGAYTYLTPDIVYHNDKFKRGYEWLINIWGPDHHGYIPRLTAAVEALGKEREALKVLIVQLATIFRNGQELSMSTRRGQYISLREVLDEVGADAARFFFMMRHISAHLDFDLDLAKQQTPENPVYYVQYAHARVYSINKKAEEFGVPSSEKDFDLLQLREELDLIKKLGLFPDTLETCYYQLDPYALIAYLQDLGAVFHRFYDGLRVISEDKKLSSQRLGLVNATRIVIANGLKLLGVSAPKSM